MPKSTFQKKARAIAKEWSLLDKLQREIELEEKPPWHSGLPSRHIAPTHLLKLAYSLLFLHSYELLKQSVGKRRMKDADIIRLRKIRNAIAHNREKKRIDRKECCELRETIRTRLVAERLLKSP